MPGFDLLITNLLSPIVLAFALGALAGFIRSELELPEPVLKLLSIYLLFSIGLVGGHEIAKAELGALALLLLAAVALTIAIPVTSFWITRRFGGFDASNAAAIAAHYGSVSSVTFFAAVAFAKSAGTESGGYMTAVVALMEWGVIIALLLARWSMGRAKGAIRIGALVADTCGSGHPAALGGMLIGALASERQWEQISPLYEDLFRGVLMIFLLEMGMTAARQVRGFLEVGRFMTAFAILSPLAWGLIGRDTRLAGGSFDRQRLRSGCGCRLGELYRRAGGLPRLPARGQSGHLSYRLTWRHLSVQPAHRHPALLCLCCMAVRTSLTMTEKTAGTPAGLICDQTPYVYTLIAGRRAPLARPFARCRGRRGEGASSFRSTQHRRGHPWIFFSTK